MDTEATQTALVASDRVLDRAPEGEVMTKRKYPKEVYVTTEDDQGTPYLIVHEHLEDVAVAGDVVKVAVYDLREIVSVVAPIDVVK